MSIAVENRRATDWIMTSSGRPFWPLEPRVEDVRIEDIAHHLANLCRFTGAVKTFYSVAQHSVLVSQHYTWKVAALFALLHDASEAYLVDVPRPVKHHRDFALYREAEAQLQTVIYEAFGLTGFDPPTSLHRVDRRMLRTEQRDLMPPPAFDEDRRDVEPFGFTIRPVPPEVARSMFLSRFTELTRS